MWNAWTAPPGALPQDYDPWACEAQCARCGELAQDCHCEDEMNDQQQAKQVATVLRNLAAVNGPTSGQAPDFEPEISWAELYEMADVMAQAADLLDPPPTQKEHTS